MKKRILTTLLTVVLLTTAFSVTALAWDGWTDNGGSWSYYQNDQPVTGWLSLNGKWYYMDGSGAMTTGWQLVDGTWYYMYDSGAMTTGWQYVDGAWYYMDGSGAMTTGWQLVNGTWYYMYDSGVMSTGWQLVDGTWYYMEESGAMKTGWLAVQVGEHQHYFTGKTIKEFEWYYFSGSGAMVTGWVYEEPEAKSHKSGWYYMDEDGRLHNGWLQSGGAWYYISISTNESAGAQERGGMLADSGLTVRKQNGTEDHYWFKPDGKMACNEIVKESFYGEDGRFVRFV